MANVYNKMSFKVNETHFNSTSNRYDIQVETPELGSFLLSFDILPKDQWKSGTSAYGEWNLCGNVDFGTYGKDVALFTMTDFNDKTKIVGASAPIKKGSSYLNIYFTKDPEVFNVYIKTKVEEVLPGTPEDDTF